MTWRRALSYCGTRYYLPTAALLADLSLTCIAFGQSLHCRETAVHLIAQKAAFCRLQGKHSVPLQKPIQGGSSARNVQLIPSGTELWIWDACPWLHKRQFFIAASYKYDF